MRALAPHVILVVGPAFGASRGPQSLDVAAQTIRRWLQALSERAQRVMTPASPRRPIVFTGQPDDAAQFQAQLQPAQGSAPTFHAVQALSPSTLAPLNRAVGPIYESATLRPTPGYDRLRALIATPPMATITSLGGVACFLAQHYAMNVIVADVGALVYPCWQAATAEGEFVPGSQPTMGVGPGAGRLLRAVGAENIIRWLPFALDKTSARVRLASHAATPHVARLAGRTGDRVCAGA